MIVTICGKGGSGKSTITSMLAKEYAARGRRVLVIDCDESNYGLHQQLGMDLPESFTDNFGGKARVMEMLADGPQGMPALFDRRWRLDDIPERFRTLKDGVMLMSPGKIETANEACACPFVAVAMQFVDNLDLDADDVVLMDMEAGIEHFGRGADNSADAVLMVVDPSYESIKLSGKVAEICGAIGKPVFFALNKMPADALEGVRGSVPDPSRVCGALLSDGGILAKSLRGEELSAGNPDIVRMADFIDRAMA